MIAGPSTAERASEAQPLERHDPVLWSGADASGPLSSEQLGRYERDGFLVVPGWIAADEADALSRTATAVRDDASGHRVFEAGSDTVRTVFAVDRGDGRFARLARDPRLIGVAEQILGGPVYVHQSRINFKAPFRGGDFWWHSDYEIWQREDAMPAMRALSVTLMLTASLPENGPMWFVPGSHRSLLPRADAKLVTDHKRELERQDYTAPREELLGPLVERLGMAAAIGGAGTLVVSDCNVLHVSGPNPSPWPRELLFYCYNSVDNALRWPASGEPRPDYLANRDGRRLPPLP